MTRKSSQTDEKIIEAALLLLDEKGFSSLKVRQVCQKAGVNLGLFHYHFKTKDEFERRVLKHMYDRFFRDFNLKSGGEGDPLDRLRRAVHTLGHFIRENRSLILGMMHDAMSDDQVVVDFVTENFPRHAIVLADLIKQCQAKGLIIKKPFYLILPHFIGAVAAPNIVVGLLEKAKTKALFGVALSLFKDQILSDAALDERIDIVLRGLGAPERKKA